MDLKSRYLIIKNVYLKLEKIWNQSVLFEINVFAKIMDVCFSQKSSIFKHNVLISKDSVVITQSV